MKTNDLGTDETNFENVYNINISDLTLRELLIFQSIYLCKTDAQINKVVQG